MKGKWIKDYCPFAKDQGFDGIIGNVAPGELVFGFKHVQVGATDTIYFNPATEEKVTMMRDTLYRILVTKSSAGSVLAVPYTTYKYKDSFDLTAETGQEYDIIVIGKVGY